MRTVRVYDLACYDDREKILYFGAVKGSYMSPPALKFDQDGVITTRIVGQFRLIFNTHNHSSLQSQEAKFLIDRIYLYYGSGLYHKKFNISRLCNG